MPRPSTADKTFLVPAHPKASVRVTFDRHENGTKHRVVTVDADGVKVAETTRATHEDALALAAEQLRRIELAATSSPAAGSSSVRVLDVLKAYLIGELRQARWSDNYELERERIAARWLRRHPKFLVTLWTDVTKIQMLTVLKDVEHCDYPYGTNEYRRVGSFLRGLVSTAQLHGWDCRDGDPMRQVKYNPPSRGRSASGNVRLVLPHEVPSAPAIALLEAKLLEHTGRPTEALRWRAGAEIGPRFSEAAAWLLSDVPAPGTTRPRMPIVRQALEQSKKRGGFVLDAPVKWGRPRDAIVDLPFLEDLQAQAFRIGAAAGVETDDWEELQMRCGNRLLLPAPRGGGMRAGVYYRDIFTPARLLLEEDPNWPSIARAAQLPACFSVSEQEAAEILAAHQERKAAGPVPALPRPCTAYEQGVEHYHFPFRYHATRHAYATGLLRRGLNIKLVSVALGHRDSNFTEARYVGTDGTEDQIIAAVLAASGSSRAAMLWRSRPPTTSVGSAPGSAATAT